MKYVSASSSGAPAVASFGAFFVNVFGALRRDYFFLALAGLCVWLTVLAPSRIADYPKLVGWPTIASLAGLLILTKGVEASGALALLGRHLIVAMKTERALALLLVSASAMLATLLTNDVALFVTVPLTLGLRGAGAIPVYRLIVFEALAVNAGSALTPIGNPQNLFLWGWSGVPFHSFIAALFPLVAIASVALVALTLVAFPKRAIAPIADAATPVERKLLWVSLSLYAPFLILTNFHQAELAFAFVLVVFALTQRRVLAGVDWGLLLVFILMFIDLRLVAQHDLVRSLAARLGPGDPQHLYWMGVLVSQVISNVPGAILLAEYSKDWRIIAYGVNVGGFGLMIASLANLIALRMTGDERSWLVFHAYSIPFLALVSAATWAWLFLF